MLVPPAVCGVSTVLSEQADVKAYALWSLALSIEDEDKQRIVADSGGMVPLIQLLSTADETTREQVGCTIGALRAIDGDSNPTMLP